MDSTQHRFPTLFSSPKLNIWVETFIRHLGPTKESEKIRREIFNYLRTLILDILHSSIQINDQKKYYWSQRQLNKHVLGQTLPSNIINELEGMRSQSNQSRHFAVLRYGSLPLMTYLPNGDIDASLAIFDQNGYLENDKLSDYYLNMLLQKFVTPDIANHPMYPISNPELIEAEVRVLKFSIQNVAIDLSVNKVGGSCSFVLLDIFNNLFVKQHHLFKRSVLLIKAWCSYESRTLGSKNGLMATYALEVMVMCLLCIETQISLMTPLEVLRKFLFYYSNFDWDKYAVTATGPIELSYLQSSSMDTHFITSPRYSVHQHLNNEQQYIPHFSRSNHLDKHYIQDCNDTELKRHSVCSSFDSIYNGHTRKSSLPHLSGEVLGLGDRTDSFTDLKNTNGSPNYSFIPDLQMNNTFNQQIASSYLSNNSQIYLEYHDQLCSSFPDTLNNLYAKQHDSSHLIHRKPERQATDCLHQQCKCSVHCLPSCRFRYAVTDFIEECQRLFGKCYGTGSGIGSPVVSSNLNQSCVTYPIKDSFDHLIQATSIQSCQFNKKNTCSGKPLSTTLFQTAEGTELDQKNVVIKTPIKKKEIVASTHTRKTNNMKIVSQPSIVNFKSVPKQETTLYPAFGIDNETNETSNHTNWFSKHRTFYMDSTMNDVCIHPHKNEKRRHELMYANNPIAHVCLCGAPLRLDSVLSTPVSASNSATTQANFKEALCCMEGSDANGIIAGKYSQFLFRSMNIVDPLQSSNNLGRSVSVANFYRIIESFKRGSSILEAVIQTDNESALQYFFQNGTKVLSPVDIRVSALSLPAIWIPSCPSSLQPSTISSTIFQANKCDASNSNTQDPSSHVLTSLMQRIIKTKQTGDFGYIYPKIHRCIEESIALLLASVLAELRKQKDYCEHQRQIKQKRICANEAFESKKKNSSVTKNLQVVHQDNVSSIGIELCNEGTTKRSKLLSHLEKARNLNKGNRELSTYGKTRRSLSCPIYIGRRMQKRNGGWRVGDNKPLIKNQLATFLNRGTYDGQPWFTNGLTKPRQRLNKNISLKTDQFCLDQKDMYTVYNNEHTIDNRSLLDKSNNYKSLPVHIMTEKFKDDNKSTLSVGFGKTYLSDIANSNISTTEKPDFVNPIDSIYSSDELEVTAIMSLCSLLQHQHIQQGYSKTTNTPPSLFKKGGLSVEKARLSQSYWMKQFSVPNITHRNPNGDKIKYRSNRHQVNGIVKESNSYSKVGSLSHDEFSKTFKYNVGQMGHVTLNNPTSAITPTKKKLMSLCNRHELRTSSVHSHFTGSSIQLDSLLPQSLSLPSVVGTSRLETSPIKNFDQELDRGKHQLDSTDSSGNFNLGLHDFPSLNEPSEINCVLSPRSKLSQNNRNIAAPEYSAASSCQSVKLVEDQKILWPYQSETHNSCTCDTVIQNHPKVVDLKKYTIGSIDKIYDNNLKQEHSYIDDKSLVGIQPEFQKINSRLTRLETVIKNFSTTDNSDEPASCPQCYHDVNEFKSGRYKLIFHPLFNGNLFFIQHYLNYVCARDLSDVIVSSVPKLIDHNIHHLQCHYGTSKQKDGTIPSRNRQLRRGLSVDSDAESYPLHYQTSFDAFYCNSGSTAKVTPRHFKPSQLANSNNNYDFLNHPVLFVKNFSEINKIRQQNNVEQADDQKHIVGSDSTTNDTSLKIESNINLRACNRQNLTRFINNVPTLLCHHHRTVEDCNSESLYQFSESEKRLEKQHTDGADSINQSVDVQFQHPHPFGFKKKSPNRNSRLQVLQNFELLQHEPKETPKQIPISHYPMESFYSLNYNLNATSHASKSIIPSTIPHQSKNYKRSSECNEKINPVKFPQCKLNQNSHMILPCQAQHKNSHITRNSTFPDEIISDYKERRFPIYINDQPVRTSKPSFVTEYPKNSSNPTQYSRKPKYKHPPANQQPYRLLHLKKNERKYKSINSYSNGISSQKHHFDCVEKSDTFCKNNNANVQCDQLTTCNISKQELTPTNRWNKHSSFLPKTRYYYTNASCNKLRRTSRDRCVLHNQQLELSNVKLCKLPDTSIDTLPSLKPKYHSKKPVLAAEVEGIPIIVPSHLLLDNDILQYIPYLQTDSTYPLKDIRSKPLSYPLWKTIDSSAMQSDICNASSKNNLNPKSCIISQEQISSTDIHSLPNIHHLKSNLVQSATCIPLSTNLKTDVVNEDMTSFPKHLSLQQQSTDSTLTLQSNHSTSSQQPKVNTQLKNEVLLQSQGSLDKHRVYFDNNQTNDGSPSIPTFLGTTTPQLKFQLSEPCIKRSFMNENMFSCNESSSSKQCDSLGSSDNLSLDLIPSNQNEQCFLNSNIFPNSKYTSPIKDESNLQLVTHFIKGLPFESIHVLSNVSMIHCQSYNNYVWPGYIYQADLIKEHNSHHNMIRVQSHLVVPPSIDLDPFSLISDTPHIQPAPTLQSFTHNPLRFITPGVSLDTNSVEKQHLIPLNGNSVLPHITPSQGMNLTNIRLQETKQFSICSDSYCDDSLQSDSNAKIIQDSANIDGSCSTDVGSDKSLEVIYHPMPTHCLLTHINYGYFYKKDIINKTVMRHCSQPLLDANTENDLDNELSNKLQLGQMDDKTVNNNHCLFNNGQFNNSTTSHHTKNDISTTDDPMLSELLNNSNYQTASLINNHRNDQIIKDVSFQMKQHPETIINSFKDHQLFDINSYLTNSIVLSRQNNEHNQKTSLLTKTTTQPSALNERYISPNILLIPSENDFHYNDHIYTSLLDPSVSFPITSYSSFPTDIQIRETGPKQPHHFITDSCISTITTDSWTNTCTTSPQLLKDNGICLSAKELNVLKTQPTTVSLSSKPLDIIQSHMDSNSFTNVHTNDPLITRIKSEYPQQELDHESVSSTQSSHLCHTVSGSMKTLSQKIEKEQPFIFIPKMSVCNKQSFYNKKNQRNTWPLQRKIPSKPNSLSVSPVIRSTHSTTDWITIPHRQQRRQHIDFSKHKTPLNVKGTTHKTHQLNDRNSSKQVSKQFCNSLDNKNYTDFSDSKPDLRVTDSWKCTPLLPQMKKDSFEYHVDSYDNVGPIMTVPIQQLHNLILPRTELNEENLIKSPKLLKNTSSSESQSHIYVPIPDPDKLFQLLIGSNGILFPLPTQNNSISLVITTKSISMYSRQQSIYPINQLVNKVYLSLKAHGLVNPLNRQTDVQKDHTIESSFQIRQTTGSPVIIAVNTWRHSKCRSLLLVSWSQCSMFRNSPFFFSYSKH